MPPFGVQAASGALFTLLFILWAREGWGGERTTVAFAVIASALVPAAAAWACWLRARRSPRELKLAWRLLGAATLSWALGQTYWAWFELSTGAPPEVPSPADIGYLALLPLAALGVTALVRHTGRARVDPRPLLDGAIVGSSFIFAAFALGLEGIVLDSLQTDVALIVNLLYPFGDGVVLGVVLTRLSRAPPQARGVVALLATGFLMLAIADLWFLVVDAQGVYSTGGVLDAFWIMGFQLIGLAAMRPANLEEAVDAPAQSRTLSLVPIYPFLAATACAVYAELQVGYLSDTLFWTALTVILLVLARLIVMLFDNIALTQSLRSEQALRTQMLNNVTHDLLSPLSPVRLQMKLLLEGHRGPLAEGQQHSLAIVQRNLERVNRLAVDLKDMANLEGHRLNVVLGDLDVAQEARRAASTFQEEARTRQVALTVEAPETAPLRGDAGRIGQVLDNLLSNALKFTPAGGTVTVRVAGGNPEWSVSVTDSGRGLTDDEAARLFQPFSQVHKPGEIKERGTGLGLYISRGIAQGHGGDLSVSSPGPGKGSTFRLALPITAARPPASHPSQAPQSPESGKGERID